MKPIDYDQISRRYDRSRSFSEEFTREILDILPAGASPRRVLDAGCGTGNATARLEGAWPEARVVGLDLSAGMLAEARRKPGRAALLRADSARLPLADSSFDLIFSAYMLHHLPGPGGFLAEAARVLAPGGWLIILTAGHEQIKTHFLSRFFPSFAEIDCARFPPINEIKSALVAAGLRAARRREITVAEYAVDQAYLRRVADRHISTFELMSDEDFRAGLARLAEWVEAEGAKSKKMPRHEARGTLLLAEKP